MDVYTWTQPSCSSFLGVYILTQPSSGTPPTLMPSAVVWVFTLGPSPAAAFTTIFEANKIKKGKV